MSQGRNPSVLFFCLGLITTPWFTTPTIAAPAIAQNHTSKFEQLFPKAQNALKMGQVDRAITLSQEILQHPSVQQNSKHQAQTLLVLGDAYRRKRNYQQAAQSYKASLRLLAKLPYYWTYANTHIQLGMVYKSLGQPEAAITQLKLARQLSEKHNKPDLEYLAWHYIGNVYNGIGQPSKAAPFLTKALKLAQVRNNQAGILMSLSELGLMALFRGEYAQAITHLEKSRQLAIDLKDRDGEQLITANLGIAHAAIGDYQKALRSYKVAWKLAKQLKDPVAEGKVLGSIGILYRRTGNYKQALKFGNASLKSARATNNRYEQMITLMDIGLAYDNLNQPDTAIKVYRQALKLAEASNHTSAQGKLYGNLAGIYYGQNKLPQAIEFIRRSIAIAKQTGDQRELGVGFQNLGTFLNAAERYGEAEDALRQSIAIWDKQRDELNRNQPTRTADRQKVLLFERQISSYNKLQYSLVAQVKITDALTVAEQTRTRALTELMARKQTGDPIKLAETLNINVDRLKQIAREQNATIVEYSLLPYRITLPDTAAATLGFRQANLLAWVIQPNGDITLRGISTSTDIAAHSAPLNEMIRASRDAIGARNRGIKISRAVGTLQPETTLDSPLQQLHQTLIAPITDLLPQDAKQHVIFIPQGALFNVPFPALQDAQGRYLIERHTIRTAPSIQVLGLTQASQQFNANRNAEVFKNALIVGNPTMPLITNNHINETLSDLPNAETEAKQIAAITNTNALTGQHAKKSVVLNRMAEAKLLHFATHGLLDTFTDLGIPGAIALAPDGTGQPNDGLLTADELLDQRTKLNADLVVLSACNTGQGDIKGDGVLGLSRSFLAAGVSSLVVSHWAVDDASTAYLMTKFYQNLKTMPDRAAALRQAMLTTKEKYPNPYHWAAFSLIGQR